MEAIRFEPILKRIRWGGRKLGTVLGKRLGPEPDYAESWEIADHAAGQSRVADGPYAGQSLAELLRHHGPDIFGTAPVPEQFPLLIKFLDANDWLSLQVHPNDVLAREFDARENGKTEAWVILDAAPDSRICAGLREGVTRDDLERAVRSGQFDDCLHRIAVRPGDCVFVPAGTVHALGPGILLAEIQQQSNLTFRLHDWGRVGSDGQPRPIHIDESLRCTDFRRGPVDPVTPECREHDGGTDERLVRCEHFTIDRRTGADPVTVRTAGRFRILMLLDGTADVTGSATGRLITRGTTLLVPAACEELTVTPRESMTLLEVSAGTAA